MQEITNPARNIPGPERKPFLGNIPHIKGRDLIRFHYDMWQDYGDLLRLKLGPVENYVLAHPDYIQHVLVKRPDIYTKGFTMEKLRIALARCLELGMQIGEIHALRGATGSVVLALEVDHQELAAIIGGLEEGGAGAGEFELGYGLCGHAAIRG